jgi:uncharacterized oxidoreductase
MGEHKGSGLAVICELLGGAVTGGGILSKVPYADGMIGNNMLSFLLDPARLPGGGGLAADTEATIAWLKASPPADPSAPVLVAGEPERLVRAEREEKGIPVAAGVWEDLLQEGRNVGVVVKV